MKSLFGFVVSKPAFRQYVGADVAVISDVCTSNGFALARICPPCGWGDLAVMVVCTLSRAHAGVKQRVVHASMLSLPTGPREVRGHGSPIVVREELASRNTHTVTTRSQYHIRYCAIRNTSIQAYNTSVYFTLLYLT